MQTAKVIALRKGGYVHNLSNYRSISIPPTFSKGLEKVIYLRITSFFLKKISNLSHSQFAFRKRNSTETALLEQKKSIIDAYENRPYLSKAFGPINHGVLIRKLEAYGVHGLAPRLISSYLQYIAYNTHLS